MHCHHSPVVQVMTMKLHHATWFSLQHHIGLKQGCQYAQTATQPASQTEDDWYERKQSASKPNNTLLIYHASIKSGAAKH